MIENDRFVKIGDYDEYQLSYPLTEQEVRKIISDQKILEKIRLYCEGKSTVNVLELIKRGL